ncbi:MAG: hypothetical protein HC915_14500 [Anaerolineae bacterium]|nr:hypothetical protein [Anaerolineae bacterium]
MEEKPRLSIRERSPLMKTVEEYPIDFTRLFYMLQIDLEQQINRADRKAQLVLSANALFAALATGTSFSNLNLDDLSTSDVGQLILLTGLGLSVIGSINYALRATFPSFISVSPTQDQPQEAMLNLYFFEDIASLSLPDFRQRFLDLSLQEVKDHILGQIHAKANVLSSKYRLLRQGIRFLTISFVLWIGIQFLQNLL